MLTPLLIIFQLFLSFYCYSTTTEKFIWDMDEINETAAMNQSTTSEQISEVILKDYARSMTPCKNGPVEIFFDVAGILLAKVQANQRTITAGLSLVMRWNDYRLRWNPADHSNVTEISMPDYVVWLPPFLFYSSVKYKFLQNENARLVRISKNGEVYYLAPISMTATCWMGTGYFPFDVQDCTLPATTPLLGAEEVVLRAGVVFDYQFLTDMGNDEFDIRNVSISAGNYSEFGEQKTEIYITIRMARHSLCYVIVLIIPTALLSFIATPGFFGTSSTNCITNIAFSSLLTISMLLQILSGIVPKSSELPLLGYYIVVTLFLMCAGAILSILIASIEKKVEAGDIGSGPPRWMMKMCCGKVEGKDTENARSLSFKMSIPESDELTRWVRRFLECAQANVAGIRAEIENEKMTKSWRLVFRRCRFVLLLIFELVHLAILIGLLSFWGKENIAPIRFDADGIPL